MATWIKTYRSLLDWQWYTDGNTFRVFMHLLLKANHKGGKWKGQTVKRGQVITGRHKLAKELGMSEQNIRTALKHLKSTNEITSEITNQYTIITIINYGKYQAYGTATNQPTNSPANQRLTNDQPTTNQRLTTNKKDKSIKNDKKDKKHMVVFEHYISLPLIKHKALTGDMKKSIDTALKEYGGDVELLKFMATRHYEKLQLTKDTDYPIKCRGLNDLYGTKKYKSKSLICSDYDDGAWDMWQAEFNKRGNNNSKSKSTKVLERFIENEQIYK